MKVVAGYCFRLLVPASLLLLAACSDGSAPTDAEPASPSVEATTSTRSEEPTLSAEPSLPTPITTDGAEKVDLSERQDLLLGKFPDEPDWLAVGFGSLWAQQGNGSVLRFAPNGKLLATIDAGIWKPPTCQGIGISADSVWACATEGKIIRIDPKINDITATLDIPKLNEQGRLIAAAGHLWLLTGDGAELTGVSLKDNSLSDPIKLGAYCTDLAVGDDESLWVVCASDGSLLRVQPDTGEVTGRVTGLPLAANAAVADDVWVISDEGLARIDTETLDVIALYGIYGGVTTGIRAYPDAVWIRQESPFLTQIDPRSGEVVKVIHSRSLTSSGDVIEMGNKLWTAAYDDQRLIRLRK
jgi:streptogramin lyase